MAEKLNNGQNLKKDYFWNMLGSSMGAIVAFILTVIITRVNGVETVGVFTYIFGMMALISTVMYFGGRNYQISDTKNEFQTREYLLQRIVTTFLGVAIAVVFAILNGFSSYYWAALALICVYYIGLCIAEAYYGVMQKNRRLYQAGQSLFFKSVIGVVLFLVIDLLTHDLLLSLCGLFPPFILGLIFYDMPVSNKLEKIRLFGESSSKYIQSMKKIIKATYMLMFVLFFQSATTNILRYLVEIYSPEQQGVFGIIIMPAFFLNLLVSFIFAPQITVLAEHLKIKNLSAFSAVIRKVMLAIGLGGIAILVCAYFVAVPIMDLIYGSNVGAEGFSPYLWRILAVIFGGIFFVITTIYLQVSTIIRKIKIQVVVLGIGLATEIIAGIFLVKNFGMEGAIIAYVAVNAIQAVTLIALHRNHMKVLRERV